MVDIVSKYRSVSFIGMSKNAGKTTTLNFFIEKTRGVKTLGLSSIGRDGESLDRVTGTEKPKRKPAAKKTTTKAAAKADAE